MTTGSMLIQKSVRNIYIVYVNLCITHTSDTWFLNFKGNSSYYKYYINSNDSYIPYYKINSISDYNYIDFLLVVNLEALLSFPDTSRPHFSIVLGILEELVEPLVGWTWMVNS